MMAVDGLASFVPAIEAGARALQREGEKARHDFRLTDAGHCFAGAETLARLARRLDVRRPR